MGKQESPNTRHRFLVLFLFHFLLFSYPLLSLLWRRSYPFFTTEVGALFLLLAVFCILLTVILRNVRLAIVNVLSTLLVTITLMLQFDLLSLGVILCASISLVVAWRLRTHFQFYSLPVLITLIMGAYFDSFEDDGNIRSVGEPTSINSELPPVVHILMDGFIGLDGLPPHPASEALSKEISTFFNNFEFRVFPSAYSRFATTGDSVYTALNFRNDGNSVFNIETLGRREHILRSSSQFDAMQELGYRFNIYQTGYLDFCQSNPDYVERCWEYAQPNTDLIRLVPSLQLKLKMLVKVLVSQSTLLSNLVVSRRWLLDQGIANHDPQVFTNLADDLLSEPRGKYFFAHVLLPHGPFAFMKDCSINYESPLWAKYASIEGEPVQSDEIYEIRITNYIEQVHCAVKSLQQLFEEMKMAGIYEQSIIVIHGDHGSRIGKFKPEYKNLEMLTPAIYRAHFSTMFAVKFPHKSGQVDERVLPLSTLLEEFSAAVQSYVSGQEVPIFKRALLDSPDKVEPFVYVQGVYPMRRVDINIFED